MTIFAMLMRNLVPVIIVAGLVGLLLMVTAGDMSLTDAFESVLNSKLESQPTAP